MIELISHNIYYKKERHARFTILNLSLSKNDETINQPTNQPTN